jgi:hypothetical protein
MARKEPRTGAEKAQRREYDRARRAYLREKQREYRANPKNRKALRESLRKAYEKHRVFPASAAASL